MLLLLASAASAPAVNVLTQHNDNFRTGANLSEFTLTVSNVNTGQFGKLFSRAVDGQIYAQPLYVTGLVISNKLRNVVYVATEHNSVYAFDADDPAASNALWQVNLGPTTPASELICNDITPEIGITSTPVIDPATSTMYLAAKTKEIAGTVTNYFYKLHALDTLTGQEKFGGPVVIQGSVPGTGIGSDGTNVAFNAFRQWSRSGFLLLSNVVHIAIGEACNTDFYHGWLFSYNATNLQRLAIFCTTPNGMKGGIWASGMGPAVDADGFIYVATANGNFDKDTGGLDIGDSVVKFSVSNGIPQVADWFTPHDQAVLFTNDLDLGAGGPVVIPSTNLLVQIGKLGVVYLVNRQHLGGYVNYSSDTNIVQEFLAYDEPYFIGQSPVYWKGPTNEFIYFWSFGMPLTAYKFTGTMIVTNPVATGSTTQTVPRVGGISLSANGNAAGSGIVWGTEASSNGVLHAYEAENVAHELWNSQQIAARDALGNYVKFCAPTIVNGKVYVPTTSNALVVYGLLAPLQSVSPANFGFGTLTTGTTAQTTFVVTDLGGGPLTGTVATAGPFAIVSGGSYTVVSGGSTNVVVSFTPSSAGNFTNNVIFTSNGGVSTNPVTGAGVTPPNLSVSPGSFNYGTLVIGHISNQLFSVINTGGQSLTGSATVAGAPYSITAGSPFSVAPGQTQSVTVTFSPVAAGTFSTNLIVASNGGTSSNALTGVGVTPAQLAVSPPSLNFGAIATGSMAYASFTATNSGGASLSGTAIVGIPFAVVTNGSFSLSGFATTNVVVQFAPVTTGTWTSNVVFTSTGGNSTNAVTGTALTPGSVTVTPATLNFGTLATGTTAQASFVVTNTGGIAVSNGTATVTGGPFSIISGAAFSVSGLGSTNVVLQFAPITAGGFTNTVVFTTANGGNATNTVTGTGAIAPTAHFTASPIAGTEPLGVTFSDTSTGTPPLTLYWNLGDSVLATNSGGANFNHTYAAGTYTVTLTASNALGTSTLVSNNLISVVTALQAWQLHYFGCTNCPQAQPNADPFGTGLSNTNKFLAGFNPTNPAAYLHVISIANTNTTDINVIYLGANGDNTWSPGIASRTNVLEFTAGTANGEYSNNFATANVTNILSGGTGTGLVTNMVDPGGATNSPSRYYRIRVLLP